MSRSSHLIRQRPLYYVIDSFAKSDVLLAVSGQDKGDYVDDLITFSATKCYFVGCVDPGGQELELTDDRPVNYRVWSETNTWNLISGVWEAQSEGTGSASTIPPNDKSLEVVIPRGLYAYLELALDAIYIFKLFNCYSNGQHCRMLYK